MHISRLATVGEMAAGLAHELNQPLAAVANYAQACDRLLRLPDPDLTEISYALRQITSQAVRAADIIRRLRGLAQGDSPRAELTDINSLITELSELILSDARQHRVRCRLELAASLPSVYADRGQIQQVVLNLVRNACEALASDPAEPREVVIRTALTPEAGVEIQVRDTGPGVSPSIRTRLFDPFCTTKSSGTGLGLASSRTIARCHGGSLDYSPQGHGACFVLRLPAKKTASPS